MSKKLNTEAITNELTGSAFFSRSVPKTTPSLDNSSGKGVKSTQVDKPTKPQVDKTTSGQVDISTSTQVDMTTSKQVVKPTSRRADKTTSLQVEKYTTHMPYVLIERVKREAFENKKKDYEIIVSAVEEYFERRK